MTDMSEMGRMRRFLFEQVSSASEGLITTSRQVNLQLIGSIRQVARCVAVTSLNTPTAHACNAGIKRPPMRIVPGFADLASTRSYPEQAGPGRRSAAATACAGWAWPC